jgi:CHAD domain-containing protein
MGIKRVAMDELERAASGFFEPEEQFPDAVHEARKSIKRLRALLALVKGELGERVYTFEDSFLRNTARTLAEVRSAVAVVEAADLVRSLYGEFLAPDTFEETILRLQRRRDIVMLKAMEDPHLVGSVVADMERAYHRYSSWPIDPEARSVYGVGVRDHYDSIAPGLGSTYDSGRRRMVAAYRSPTDDNFHDWRKRVKTLRHQIEFLMPLWPEVLSGLAATLDTLGFFLGEDHDHADLLGLLRVRPDLCSHPRERSVLFALVTQRRSELRLAAEILGRRVYAEETASFRHRFGEYWESRTQALTTPFDTLVVY